MSTTKTGRGARTVCWALAPSADNSGIIRISVGRTATDYWLTPIACDLGGRGFKLEKFGAADLYHVRIGQAQDCDCDCLGFLRHRRCKHVLGLLALEEAGQLRGG